MTPNSEHTELVNRILRSARWATVLKVSAQVFSWLSTIIVVRFISPQDYGLNSMLESPLVLMMMLSTLGLEAALVQAKNINTDDLQSIFGWLLSINGILFLGYFFGSGLLAAYYNEPRLEGLAKALAIIFLLVPLRVIPNALLDRQLDFKLRAQLELFSTVASAIVTLVLAYDGAGIWALVLGVITGKLLLSVLLSIYKPWFIVPKFNLFATWRLMSVGGILTLAGGLILLSDQLVSFIAGPRIGAQLLGIFSLGAQFASLPMAKCMPIINQTMLPSFTVFRESPEVATYYLKKTVGLTSLILFPVMVGMACVADQFVPVVAGAGWGMSIKPLQIVSLGMLFRMNTMLLRSVSTSMGRADITLTTSVIQLLALFPATFYALEFGVIGLAVAWALTECLVTIATTYLSRSVVMITLTNLMRCYTPALVSSIVMAGCVFLSKQVLLNANAINDLLIAIVVGIISYLFTVRYCFKNQFQTTIRVFFKGHSQR